VAEFVTAVAVLLWLTVALRWPTRNAERGQILLWRALLLLAVLATLKDPWVRGGLDRSVPGSAAWQPVVPHLAALSAGYIAVELARGIALPAGEAPRGERVRVAALVAALVTELGLSVWLVNSHHSIELGDQPPGVSATAYWLVFLGGLGVALARLTTGTLWFRSRTAPGSMRTSVTLVGVGSVIGLLYILQKVIVLLADLWRIGSWYARVAPSVGDVLIAAALAPIAVGCSFPLLDRLAIPARVRRATAYRDLAPLWWAMYDATPSIALDPPVGVAGPALFLPFRRLRELDVQLYRRVIEIRDGGLALRPFTPRVSADELRKEAVRLGISGADLPAVLAAAEWELARRRKARGELPRTIARTQVGGGTDLESEVEQLRTIARAWHDAELVADQVERTISA